MKKFLIAGNWKMNKLQSETAEFAKEIKEMDLSNAKDVAVLAPFTDLKELGSALEGSGIGFGAQNVHFEPSGAFTGEISVPMLKEIGVDYCIVGHSERREYFGETDETVNKKLKALLEADITPILCVGESLEVRESGSAMTFVAGQITADFDGISAEDAARIVVAYEPIWAIGTGKTATPDQAEEMCGFIRGIIGGLYAAEDTSEYSVDDIAENMLILYGGSMKPSNAKDLLAKPDINGGLIGGASLKAADLAAIAAAALEVE
ncbi:MAG: triose-phosphate isomerase [Mogibacterium sp.]|nr:triose-phosphate isomerase [Mogibacterium sp.]